MNFSARLGVAAAAVLALGALRAARSGASRGVAEAQPARFKIYTRQGDDGSSGLFAGGRRRKCDAVFEALGGLDELNAALGLAMEHCRAGRLRGLLPQLEAAQGLLLQAGASLATDPAAASERAAARVAFPAGRAAALEAWIDALDAELPPLTTFVLPGGGLAAAQLHVARSVCRRAERAAAAVEWTPSEVSTYLNRLSDALFTAARWAVQAAGKKERAYHFAT